MSQPKSVRFDALAKSSSQPEQVTLWVKPEDDAEFMKVVKQNRVATVIQANVGTKKDFGVVGFKVNKNAAYLVFPKPLFEEDGTKIIGIKYGWLAASGPKGPVFRTRRNISPGIPMRQRHNDAFTKGGRKSNEAGEKPRVGKVPKQKKAEALLFRYRAEVLLTATQKTEIEVAAASSSAAGKLIHAQLKGLQVDPSSARIVRKMRKAKKVGVRRSVVSG